MENRELNLFDLIVMFVNWCGRVLRALLHLLGSALRLAYRMWWVVLICTLLGAAYGLYNSRSDNRMYKAGAIAVLNGPDNQLIHTVAQPLTRPMDARTQSPYTLDQVLDITPDLASAIHKIELFNVIDCYRDSTIDYVDFKHKSARSDTVNAIAPRYIYLQVQTRKVDLVPQMEEAILRYLNTRPNLVQLYNTYRNTEEQRLQAANNQLTYLDSLSHRMYTQEPVQQRYRSDWHSVLIGEEKHQILTDRVLYASQLSQSAALGFALCNAPVVLLDHMAVDPHPINGPIRTTVLFAFLGLVAGLLIALLVEQRRRILQYLRS